MQTKRLHRPQMLWAKVMPLHRLLQSSPTVKPPPTQRKRGPSRTPRQHKRRLPPWFPPSLPNPWWRCAVTTDPVKNGLRHPLDAMAVEMAALASAARAPVVTEAQALVALAIVALSAQGIVLAIVGPVKTEALAWVMRLFAPNAKPWSAPRCRCASWPRKRTARPLAVC